jgi:DNA-binding transcriptional LysR family regulator
LRRREGNLTRLADFGRLIALHLRQVLADAEGAKTTAKRFLSLQEAQIRLDITCTVGPARFMSFLAVFHVTNPGCEITLVEGVTAGLSELIAGRTRPRSDGAAQAVQRAARRPAAL